MKFRLYTSTPGLERFPQAERFGIWRSTHRRLMQEDGEYRRDLSRFRAKVVWPTVLYTAAVLVLVLVMVVSDSRGRAVSALNVVCLGALSVGYAVYVIVAAFRMQEFMNERVAKALPERMI